MVVETGVVETAEDALERTARIGYRSSSSLCCCWPSVCDDALRAQPCPEEAASGKRKQAKQGAESLPGPDPLCYGSAMSNEVYEADYKLFFGMLVVLTVIGGIWMGAYLTM